MIDRNRRTLKRLSRLASRAAVAVSLLWGVAALAAGDGPGASGSAWSTGLAVVPTKAPTTARLIAAATATGDARSLSLGLHMRMQPGWKVYWRSPGPAGYPPSIDWSGSKNLASAEMRFPTPHRFKILGFESLGYKKEVVYPITAIPIEPGKPLALRAKVSFLTCKELCLPLEADLRLDIPAGPAGTTVDSPLIARFAAKVPVGDKTAGIEVTQLTVTGPARKPTLKIVIRGRDALVKPDVFVEGPEGFEFGTPSISLSDDRRLAVLTVGGGALAKTPPSLVGKALTLTVADGERAIETMVLAEQGTATVAPPTNRLRALLVVLGLAVLGGLILNLMPCVLPVLSLKILGVVSHGGAEPRRVRLRFLASVAGILASFMVLAAATVAVKAAGLAVGWGVQFQQPAFLVFMVLLLTLFAGNLWGLFTVQLPGRFANMVGLAANEEGSLAGDFGTGAFATLLATPCSAPFLGTAVGFALARGPIEIFAVFAALGVGLALPYLLVALVPRLATRLPRPGPWMVRLKHILAFALAATAVWLLTVLAAQAGPAPATAVGMLMLAALALLWIRLRARHAARRPVLASIAVVAALAFAVPALWSGGPAEGVTGGRGGSPLLPDKSAKVPWRVFDRAAIPALVAQGKVVFVDVTADWCITCQANKTLVLYRGEVVKRLNADPVVAMSADWTRPSTAISRYLARYGRYGIPFNIVYGPGAPEGILLPEILTSGAVLSALDRAAGSGATAARK